MTTVLHLVPSWLPLSESFVHAHVAASRHRGVVVSRRRLENRSAFPHHPVVSLAPLSSGPARLVRASVLAVALAYRADLVHVHFGYHLPDALGAVRRGRLPLVVSLHGHDVTAFARSWPRHYEGLLERAALVVVPSRFIAEVALGLGARPTALAVVPAGVDAAFFSQAPLPDGPPTVLFVGRFVEKKGLDVLGRAWPEVRLRVPDARLRLLGYGALAHLAPPFGPDVEVVAPRPDRRALQVRDAIRAATAVVSPSRTASDGDAESMLLVNLEAQASGRPVVTTRHGGIPEFVDHGRTALLVPEGDHAALADALVAVLSEPGLAARLGAAGPGWAAAFDASASTARLDDLYEKVIGG